MMVIDKMESQKQQQPKQEFQTKEVDGKTLYLDEPTGEWVSKK
jgi:hypothetical protein